MSHFRPFIGEKSGEIGSKLQVFKQILDENSQFDDNFIIMLK